MRQYIWELMDIFDELMMADNFTEEQHESISRLCVIVQDMLIGFEVSMIAVDLYKEVPQLERELEMLANICEESTDLLCDALKRAEIAEAAVEFYQKKVDTLLNESPKRNRK